MKNVPGAGLSDEPQNTAPAGRAPVHTALPWALAVFSTLCAPLYLSAEPAGALCGSVLALAALLGQAALWRSLLGDRGRLSKRLLMYCCCLGLLLGAFTALGSRLTDAERVYYGEAGLYIGTLAAGTLFAGLLLRLFLLLDGRRALPLAAKGRPERQRGPLLWAVLFLCWVPALLASWPGFFCNDVTDQWGQIVTGVFNGHSPVLHTLLMGGTIKLVYGLTGSFNTAIACYTVLQMLLMSGIFAYTVGFLARLGLPRWVRWAAAAYYALFPLCAMYGVCATKDSLYTSFLLLSCLCALELVRDPAAFFGAKGRIVRFCLVCFVTLALRNNILIAFVPFSLALALLVKKPWRGRTALLLAGIFAVMAVYYGPLFSALGVKRGGKPDVLSVPMQQLARAYTVEPGAFTNEDRAVLFEILPEHVLKDYEPMLSDQIKGRFKATEFGDNILRYGGLYLRVLRKAPGAYADAFLLNTLYAWYPNAIVNGYNRAGTEPYIGVDKCYFEPRTEEPGSMESKLPGLYAFYRHLSLDVSFEKVPLLSLLFSIGAMLWLLLTGACYAAYARLSAMRAPLLLALLSCAVLLFNPIVLTRYYLILFFFFPVLLAFLAYPAMGAVSGSGAASSRRSWTAPAGSP